jgi:uncharacterized RDD family membrane protein YckC
MTKLPLQIAMAVLGAIPVLTGIITMFGLKDPIYASAALPPNPLLDSNLAFLAACGLALAWRCTGSFPTSKKRPSSSGFSGE